MNGVVGKVYTAVSLQCSSGFVVEGPSRSSDGSIIALLLLLFY